MAGPRNELNEVEQGINEAKNAMITALGGIHKALLDLISHLKGKDQHDLAIQMQGLADQLDQGFRTLYNSNEPLAKLDRVVNKIPMSVERIPKLVAAEDLQKQVEVLNSDIEKYNKASSELKKVQKSGLQPPQPTPPPQSSTPKPGG